MYFRIHNDGRGARLGERRRRRAAAALRQDSAAAVAAEAAAPAAARRAPSASSAAGSRSRPPGATSSTARSGAAGAIKSTDVAGFLYFTDPNNIELIVKVLDFGDRVLFFYGQLTNLRFTISVRDTRTGVTKTYQNTAGDCGGLDNNLATVEPRLRDGPRRRRPQPLADWPRARAAPTRSVW